MLKNNYKAIIVGAGPSGLSTALNLLKEGVSDILVIEKLSFPRYKCCAGYITSKTKNEYAKLGLNIENCNYSLIKSFNIFYKNKQRLNISNKFLFTNSKIDRVELDYALFKTAKENGVNILENTKISEHDEKNRLLTLTNGKKVVYDYLVFADGTTGFGSKYRKARNKNIAMQLVFESDIKESIDIHFGITKHGYGWVSSYNGVTNVGITDVYNPKINYKKVFDEFLIKLDISADISGLKGAFTPMNAGQPVLFGNVCYVGDAVGACDPMTLSGLRYALKSGEMCALAISENDLSIYKKYIKNLSARFFFMRIMQNIFYFAPVLWLGFNFFCRFFGGVVSKIFNNFFVNKK